MLTVRAARTDDLGAIVKLERYCFPPEVAFGRSRWHYLLTHAKGRTLLLLDETSQLMGYLSLLEHRGWDRLVIQTLAIRWTIRRQGWARRLLEQVIREGREAGWGQCASRWAMPMKRRLPSIRRWDSRRSRGCRITMAETSMLTGWCCHSLVTRSVSCAVWPASTA